jgi:glyoxylase-like metal-dependent hydrolase (beta-lactamase superfamily II)
MLAQPQEAIAALPGRITEFEAQVAKLEKDGSASTELESARQRLRQARADLESARSMEVTDIPAPNLTFDREVRLFVGGKEIHIFHVKRGHTDGDSIIYFPQDKVVHMGDLFFNKTIPFIDAAHGASTAEWIETIDGVVARVDPASQVIPGHGQVTTVEELKGFKQYFIDLQAAVKRAVDQGKTKQQASQEVKLSQYESYAVYQQRFPANVGVVYDELKARR